MSTRMTARPRLRNGIEINLRRDRAFRGADQFLEPWMKLAKCRGDGLRAKAQGRRATRMPGRACIRKDLQVGDRRSGGVEQSDDFGFCIESVEPLRLAALPAARLLVPSEQ